MVVPEIGPVEPYCRGQNGRFFVCLCCTLYGARLSRVGSVVSLAVFGATLFFVRWDGSGTRVARGPVKRKIVTGVYADRPFFSAAAGFFLPSSQLSHHLCTRRYSSHRLRLAVIKIAGGLAHVMFHVRVESFFFPSFCPEFEECCVATTRRSQVAAVYFGSKCCLQQRTSHACGQSKDFTKINRYLATAEACAQRSQRRHG